jgi:chorismate mutase
VTTHDHTQSLAEYRAQLSAIENQIADLVRQRNALSAIVSGLAVLAGKTTVEPSRRTTASATTDTPAVTVQLPDTIIGRVVQALRSLAYPKEKGPAEIQRLMVAQGLAVPNYATLFNALKRAAQREPGYLYKSGSKFGLREWKRK